MERICIYILAAVLALSTFHHTASAQIATGATFGSSSIDTDILALRNTTISQFSWSYDDYTQYAPAAVMLGIKAFGYQGRTKWGGMLVSDVFSIGIMTAAVNGIKYTVRRQRPNGGAFNSFPSGHTATSFMTATLLYKEYGWRSPWFSIGGYTVAALTGMSRIFNNRHWMSDVVAGAAVGIGSVHLGYYLTDLIFKDRHIYDGYVKPVFEYDDKQKHYVAELLFGRRFIIDSNRQKASGFLPVRGSLTGLQTDIPLIAGTGVSGRLSASSMIYIDGRVSAMYSATAGGYWNLHFARRLEFQTRAGLGYAWMDRAGGIDLTAGIGLSLIVENNFKIKGFADFESISLSSIHPWFNTFVVGFSSAWFWY